MGKFYRFHVCNFWVPNCTDILIPISYTICADTPNSYTTYIAVIIWKNPTNDEKYINKCEILFIHQNNVSPI